MDDTPLQRAERHLADGDYVQALSELEKAAPFDPQVTQRIHTALDRMKIIAAREFAVGRWSVAEGIFDAVGEHARFLSPAEREECRQLVGEIQKCRDNERKVHLGLQAAAQLAAAGQFPQSREVALRVMGDCRDPHLVARLRRLLMGLPHPLGRLIYGFDSELEAGQFARASGGATLQPVIDESLQVGGGFAWITLPGPGAGVSLVDPPPDWTDAKELNFLLRARNPGRTAFEVHVGDLNHSWVHDVAVKDRFWNPIRLPLSGFRKKGEPRWEAVTRLTLAAAAEGPAEFWIDEIRLKLR